MSVQHTPGPWMIYDTGDIASASVRTPEHTVIRAGNVKGATIGEAMANATLIAAAPGLLEATRDFAAFFAEFEGRTVMREIEEACPQWRALQAAIAKAVQS